VAYAPSRYNTIVQQLTGERDAAKARGDMEEVRRIEALGAAHQQQLHEQGFYGASAENLLVHIQPCVADALQRHGAEALKNRWELTPEAAAAAPDITMELVACFNPSEKTLKWVEQLKESKPLRH